MKRLPPPQYCSGRNNTWLNSSFGQERQPSCALAVVYQSSMNADILQEWIPFHPAVGTAWLLLSAPVCLTFFVLQAFHSVSWDPGEQEAHLVLKTSLLCAA